MSYATTSSIAGTTRGEADAWIRYIAARGGQRMDAVADFVWEVYRLAPAHNIAAHLIVAQAIHETDMFTSYWWVKRLNPGGIGITGWGPDDEKSRFFPNGTVAARAMLVHVSLYLFGRLTGELARYRDEDPRADAIPEAALGKRTTLEAFGNDDWRRYPTWAADSNYGSAWAVRINAAEAAGVLAGSPDAGEKEDPVVVTRPVRFVGLNRDVQIPVDIEVIIDIVPDRLIGHVRSGQYFSGQTKTTFHDTAAPGQNAISQRNYLHNGPSENGKIRQVGFNFAVDDKRIIQLTPLDEVTWAAGTTEGNRTSWHVEQCYGPGIDWDRSLRNAIALHAGLCAAKGWQVDTALVKHQWWFGKWCPAQVLNRGLWPSVVSRVSQAAAAIAGGASAATISAGDICAATTNLNIRADPTTSSPSLYMLLAGQETLIRDPKPIEAEGYRWWPVQSTTEKGEVVGWAADGDESGPYLVVTKDAEEPKPVPAPTYAKPLAIAELAPFVGRPIVPMVPAITIPNVGVAVPTFDRFRTLRETPRLRDFAGDEAVGPVIGANQEFDGSFTVIRPGADPVIVTPWWTRVRAADVEVVSDTPKDIPRAEGA